MKSCAPSVSTEDTDDVTLVLLAKSGHAEAFGCLVRRHETRLRRSMLAMVGSHQAAEDIAQEAFVRAFVKISSFRGDAGFYTWLFRIALNCRHSYVRRQRLPVAESVSNMEAPDSRNGQPHTAMEDAERLSLVRDALSQLPEMYRDIVVLREYDGFHYREIAETLQIELGTVRSRLARARQALRRILEPLLNEAKVD